jgi:hypothetical protein
MDRRVALSERLVTYLESDWVGGTPQQRGALAARLCDALSAVLEDLMRGQSDWDQYRWLDGVAATAITRTAPDGLHIVGGAYAMNGSKCLLGERLELQTVPVGAAKGYVAQLTPSARLREASSRNLVATTLELAGAQARRDGHPATRYASS